MQSWQLGSIGWGCTEPVVWTTLGTTWGRCHNWVGNPGRPPYAIPRGSAGLKKSLCKWRENSTLSRSKAHMFTLAKSPLQTAKITGREANVVIPTILLLLVFVPSFLCCPNCNFRARSIFCLCFFMNRFYAHGSQVQIVNGLSIFNKDMIELRYCYCYSFCHPRRRRGQGSCMLLAVSRSSFCFCRLSRPASGLSPFRIIIIMKW